MKKAEKDKYITFLKLKAIEYLNEIANKNIQLWIAKVNIECAQRRREALELKSSIIIQNSYRCYVSRVESSRRRLILKKISVGPLLRRVGR